MADIKSSLALPALIAAAILAFTGLVFLTSYRNFFYDEWDFVSAYRPKQGVSILLPHNEHWSTIPILIYRLFFSIFGLGTHVPYTVAAILGHLACVLLLFMLVRRHSGDLAALAAALMLLVLGTGATNIVWAFQVAWTISIAMGLTAMLLVDSVSPASGRWRAVAISGALLCSLMSSGIGLGFLAAVTFQLLFDTQRRRYLISVVVPIIAYLAWFIAFGAGIHGTPGALCATCPTAFGNDLGSIGPGFLRNVIAYVALSLEASAAGIFGITGAAGPVPLVVAGALLAWHWYVQEGVESWELGLVGGLFAQFTLIALTRVRFGLSGAGDPHYVYVGVVYLLPLLANAVKHLPWRGVWRPILAGTYAIALLGNATLLVEQAISQTELMRTENAELRTLELFRGAPDMALNEPLDDAIMPQLTASRYFAAVDELGSAVPSSTPDSLSNLPAYAVDHEMVVLFGKSLAVRSDTEVSTQGQDCRSVDSTAASILDIQILDGSAFVMEGSAGGDVSFALGYLAPPTNPVIRASLAANTPVRVTLPNTGRTVMWRLRVATASVGDLRICGAEQLQAQTGSTVFSAEAAGGALDPGWTSVADASALGGLAARLPAGTATQSFKNDVFGTQTVLPPGAYDVWFRVRVSSSGGDRPEMTLGLWDYTGWNWVGSTQLRANEVTSDYSWIRVAADVSPAPGHRFVFLAEFAEHSASLSTDWYVDEAAVLLAGSSPPA